MAPRERLRWLRSAIRFGLTAHPIRGGADDDEGETKDEEAARKSGEAPPAEPAKTEPEPKAGGKDDGGKPGEDDGGKPEPKPEETVAYWKDRARQHERAVEKERKRAEHQEKELKKRQDAEKTEHERAVDAAREEGRKDAEEKAAAERRKDRLEVVCTRLASRGVLMGSGDDAKRVKFADPEDALVFVERAIANDEIDSPFDDEGKVQTGDLEKVLAEILEKKPRLAAEDGRPAPVPDADAGKGESEGKSVDEMTPDEHLAAIQAERRGAGEAPAGGVVPSKRSK